MSIEAINKLKAFLYRIENSRPASIEGMNNYRLPQISLKSIYEAQQALAELSATTDEGSTLGAATLANIGIFAASDGSLIAGKTRDEKPEQAERDTPLPSTDYLRVQAGFCRDRIGIDNFMKSIAYDLGRAADEIDRLNSKLKIKDSKLNTPAKRIEELMAVLKHAVNLIRQWHCMGMPYEQAEKAWEIYKNSAPEMKDIEQALKANERVQAPAANKGAKEHKNIGA